jgi:hypothetical protein
MIELHESLGKLLRLFPINKRVTLVITPDEADKISTETIYQHLKASFNKLPTAQGIYLLGSGAWGVKDIIAAENDLGVPVVHPVAARVWYVQKAFESQKSVEGSEPITGGITLESLTVPDLAGNRNQVGEQTTCLVSK